MPRASRHIQRRMVTNFQATSGGFIPSVIIFLVTVTISGSDRSLQRPRSWFLTNSWDLGSTESEAWEMCRMIRMMARGLPNTCKTLEVFVSYTAMLYYAIQILCIHILLKSSRLASVVVSSARARLFLIWWWLPRHCSVLLWSSWLTQSLWLLGMCTRTWIALGRWSLVFKDVTRPYRSAARPLQALRFTRNILVLAKVRPPFSWPRILLAAIQTGPWLTKLEIVSLEGRRLLASMSTLSP